jgi:acyl phosphate:glycerol-3-phosphate acyltransferase
MYMNELFWAVTAYLIGSIPFGLILTRLAGLGDIRAIGSGNIGATNVLRTGNKGLAAATLFLDGFKGYIMVVLAREFAGPDAAALATVFALVGHIYPVYLKFNGGKGVATFFGVMLGYLPAIGIACLLAWVVTALITRTSSAAALVAVGLSPLFAYLFESEWGKTGVALMCFSLAILVWYRHKENIKRILNGTEPKIGRKETTP